MTPGRQGARHRGGPRPHRSTLRIAAVLAGALVLAALGALPGAGAQTLGEARDQREATRAEQARVAAELDTLKADADAIRSALAGLDEAIAYQEAKVEAAQRALHDAEATVAAAQAELARTAARADVVRQRVTDSVIDSYTGGLGRDAAQFLAANDATEVTQRNELLDVVRGRYNTDLEELRSLKEQQRRFMDASTAAMAEAAAVKVELEAAKAELDRQRAVQQELAQALQARIGDVQAESDRLAAAEAELTKVINDHLAAQAAADAAAAAARGRVASTPVITSSSASGFVVPTDGPITSPFGYRIHPILGYSRLHAGTDFGAPSGTPVWASKAGQVIFAGWNGGYGNCVIVAHDGGFSTLYAHLSGIAAGVGDGVGRGEIIGWVGSTGASTGPHLHFEIWAGGTPTDPMNYL